MSYCEENRFQPKLICAKGDMLLSEIKNFNFNTRSYNLAFTIQVPNTNVASLTGFEIYDLLEAQNKELIEKIIILDKTENEAIICILINHIAKEIGIKQNICYLEALKY
jgi:hypothetical protein